MLHAKPARYYTINQVAEICGVSRATIDRWHRERTDFPRKIALGENCARFRVSDSDTWLGEIEGWAPRWIRDEQQSQRSRFLGVNSR